MGDGNVEVIMPGANLTFVVFGNAVPKGQGPPFFAVKGQACLQAVFVGNGGQNKGSVVVEQTPRDHIIVETILLSGSTINPKSLALHFQRIPQKCQDLCIAQQ